MSGRWAGLAPALGVAGLAGLLIVGCGGGGAQSGSSSRTTAGGSSAAKAQLSSAARGGETRSPSASTTKDSLFAAATELPRTPDGILARIGVYKVTQAAYDRALAAEVYAEPPPSRVVPVPPRFTACTAHLRAAARKLGLASLSDARLQGKCRQHYEILRETVLDRLVADYWVIGGARELGVDVSEAEVQQQIERFKRSNYPTPAKLRSYLTASGQTVADLVFRTRVELLSEAIRRTLKQKVGQFPQMRLKAYYEAHKRLYATPEKRDLEIVRASTEAEARKLKREIAAGRSFASAVENKPRQAFGSNKGLVLDLEPKVYREPPLDRAIFHAKPNVLTGPVHITLGYYDFEVKRIHPPREKAFTEVASALARELPEKLYQRALSGFIAAWRTRWRVRTDCAATYVVRRCKQFKATPSMPPEDPYTLN